MIKVCHFITSLGLGGAEKLLLEISRRLDKEKYQLYIVSLLGGELEDEFRAQGIMPYIINLKSKFDLSALFKLYRFFRKNKIDILHTHLYHPTIIGRVIGRLSGIKKIINHCHYSYLYQRSFNMWLDRLTVNLASRIIVVSQASQDFCINQEGLPVDKITLIYNGVSLDSGGDSLAGEELSRFKGEGVLIGSIGRLCWDKGYQYFLQAAKIILQANPEARFVIIGDGPMKKELEAVSENLGLKDKVLFTGMRKDAARLLRQFDIFVLSSVNEGLPIALLEAMIQAKPVVVTNAGGCPEVVKNKENGLLVAKENPDLLARAIKTLLDDQDLAQRLAGAGQERIRDKFNGAVMVREIERIYQDEE